MTAFHRCPKCARIKPVAPGPEVVCSCGEQSPIEPQTLDTLRQYLAQSVAMEGYYKDKLDRELADRRGYASSSAFAAEHQVHMQKHAELAEGLRKAITRLTKS